MGKLLKAKDLAELLGYNLEYFRSAIASHPKFPKPIRQPNSRGGMTQPRWDIEKIKKHLTDMSA